MVALEKFAFNMKYEDFYSLLESQKSLFKVDTEQEGLQKIFITLTQSIFSKNMGNLELNRAFEFFVKFGINLTQNLLIEILNHGNHY